MIGSGGGRTDGLARGELQGGAPVADVDGAVALPPHDRVARELRLDRVHVPGGALPIRTLLDGPRRLRVLALREDGVEHRDVVGHVGAEEADAAVVEGYVRRGARGRAALGQAIIAKV